MARKNASGRYEVSIAGHPSRISPDRATMGAGCGSMNRCHPADKDKEHYRRQEQHARTHRGTKRNSEKSGMSGVCDGEWARQ